MQKIVFIGAGNVATSLSMALKGEREILQVYSKTLAHARLLGQKLKCDYTNNLKKISQEADVYIIAVKDDAIAAICKKLKLKRKIVIHTSGSTELNILKNVSNSYGVLWAMYSFAGKAKIAPRTAFFIEASDKKTEKYLLNLVEDLRGTPYPTNSEKRAKIHLAAVFSNNFTNHLFTITEALCKEAGVPFNIFIPLAKETADNISKQSPSLNQTGPASRNDKRILHKHIRLLKSHPMYKEVYEVLTKSIIKSTRGRKKL